MVFSDGHQLVPVGVVGDRQDLVSVISRCELVVLLLHKKLKRRGFQCGVGIPACQGAIETTRYEARPINLILFVGQHEVDGSLMVTFHYFDD